MCVWEGVWVGGVGVCRGGVGVCRGGGVCGGYVGGGVCVCADILVIQL